MVKEYISNNCLHVKVFCWPNFDVIDALLQKFTQRNSTQIKHFKHPSLCNTLFSNFCLNLILQN